MHSTALTDRELVRRYQNGDKSSFDVLLKRHHQKIFSIILYMVKDRDIANDLFQETFLKVIGTLKSGKYRDENKFSAWVARIAHNMVIDYIRVEKHMPKLRDKEEYSIFDYMPSNDDHQDVADNKEKKELIRSLIQALPIEQREVLVMRLYGELSFREIAVITSVSINTALGRMRYAIINLREAIGKQNLAIYFEA